MCESIQSANITFFCLALDTIAKLGMDTRIATIKNTLGPTGTIGPHSFLPLSLTNQCRCALAVELRSCIVSQTSIAAIDEAILSNLQNSLVTDVSVRIKDKFCVINN